jgi:signal transduction histidine kinase
MKPIIPTLFAFALAASLMPAAFAVGELADSPAEAAQPHDQDEHSENMRLVGNWDEARIERVVANLLSNAVKYSSPGTDIDVDISRELRNGKAWAVLAVSNEGVGIPEHEQDRVFEAYYRATNVAGSIGGTGVGLAGARHIVEQHGGQITVDSVVNGTTTFTVRLPAS